MALGGLCLVVEDALFFGCAGLCPRCVLVRADLCLIIVEDALTGDRIVDDGGRIVATELGRALECALWERIGAYTIDAGLVGLGAVREGSVEAAALAEASVAVGFAFKRDDEVSFTSRGRVR